MLFGRRERKPHLLEWTLRASDHSHRWWKWLGQPGRPENFQPRYRQDGCLLQPKFCGLPKRLKSLLCILFWWIVSITFHTTGLPGVQVHVDPQWQWICRHIQLETKKIYPNVLQFYWGTHSWVWSSRNCLCCKLWLFWRQIFLFITLWDSWNGYQYA